MSADGDKRADGRDDGSGDSDQLRAAPTAELAEGHPTADMTPPRRGGRVHTGDLVAGRFRIVKLVGRGGFSDVFEAVDTTADRRVALKFLAGTRSGEQVVSRMRRELRLARDLRHPNIVRVFELAEIGDSCCLVMELVEGRTLKQVVLDGGPRPLAEAVATIDALSSALAAVHAAGVVHRDLKPQNVIVTPGGTVKLLDFGLAKTPDSTGLTATGTILGTPDYMAPEQVEGKTADERSDVYSLGVIAWELLVGRPPFTGDSAIAIALQHVRARIPELRRERPDVPADLARLVRHMTEPSPARRPASGQEVLIELQRLARAPDGGAIGPAARRRRRLGIAAGAVAAMAGVVAVGVTTGVLGRSAAQLATDPFADGAVAVAVSTGSAPTSSTAGLFLDAAARAISAQLAAPTFVAVDLAGASASDREAMTQLGVEHLLELRLSSESTAAGKLYSIAATVSDAPTGVVWRELPSFAMTTLDFETVDAASSRIASSYATAVSEAMTRPREALE